MKETGFEELFAYGTLLDPAVQQRVIGRVVEGVPDSLHGYTKSTVKLGEAIYPIALPDPGGRIQGARLLLSEEELKRADAYEGPSYQRVKRSLESGRSAWVYVAPEK